jgi:hypothetical protein
MGEPLPHARRRGAGELNVRAPPAAGLGIALAALTLARLPAAWESGNALNHVSGAWMTLADDLARGTFYRPLHDGTLGFGGTRFFPLSFVAQAALVKAGVPLLLGGLLLSLAAGVAAVAGAERFLRRAGHAPLAAAGLAALVLAGFAGQHALAAVRGDLPAAALAIWGMGALLPARARGGPGALAALPWALGRGAPRPRSSVVAPALLLVLAFAAKPTALAAAGAGVAFLLLRRERGRALALAVAVAAGCAAVVVGTDLASGGRFVPMVRDLGSGGLTPHDLLLAPVRLGARLWWEDPAGLALLAAAGVAYAFTHGAATQRGVGARALAALWLAAALAATLVVLASPGTGVNHLLDLEVPAALLLAACATRRARGAVRPAAAFAAAAGLATAALLWMHDRDVSRLAAIQDALHASQEGAPAPLLSEDPLLPLLAGERPYALDPWMLRLAAERDPGLARPLLEGLEQGRFRAVILLRSADATNADEWFGREFGRAALADIRDRWTLRLVVGPYHVYRYDRGVQPSSGPRESSLR